MSRVFELLLASMYITLTHYHTYNYIKWWSECGFVYHSNIAKGANVLNNITITDF